MQQYLLIFDSRVELQHECSILQAKVKGSQDLGKRREELALKEEHNNLLNSIIRELGYEGELRYKLTQSEVSSECKDGQGLVAV